MSVVLDVHQRKGALKTMLIGIGLLLLLLFFGLRHYDPPLERGIIIALGNPEGTSIQSESSAAQSQNNPLENTKSPTSTQSQIESETPTEIPDNSASVNEKLLVTESAEVTVNAEPESETNVTQAKVAPKPDASTAEALEKILSGQGTAAQSDPADSNESARENETALGADKGSPLSESPYNLGMGLDGDGNYLLGGRRALYKEIIVQDCNQAGRVVVSIEVNQQGEVITAMPGVRGTTNNAPCLLDPARRAALATQFNADVQAPSRQIGKIIYVFRLSQ